MSGVTIGVGMVGTGAVAAAYATGMQRFDGVALVACADVDASRARAFARAHDLRAHDAPDALLADGRVEVVLNLTPPAAHALVGLAAIAAGRHVYSEKPLAATVDEAQRVVDAARRAGVLVGCAPELFLGPALQTARALIDDGAIGQPVGGSAFLLCAGHESWHPSPGFYYEPGGGPMLDMGPYYAGALVALLGPVRRVTGSTGRAHNERLSGSGTRIPVRVETHVAGVLDFVDGAIVSLCLSWDTVGSRLPHLELYGTDGALSLPDPNLPFGEVALRRRGDREWQPVPATHGVPPSAGAGFERGVGVAELARAVRHGDQPRASGELGLHVLEILTAIELASARGEHVQLTTTCSRPAPLPPGVGVEGVDG